MYPQNCWYVVANREDVTATAPYACQVAGKDIVLYRNEENQVVAMLDQCCHRLVPLSLGRIEGNDIRCGYHGIKFAEDGRCNEVPGQDQLPKSFCIKTFAALEVFEWVWVWIGDQDNVDESLLPDPGLNPAEWSIRKGVMDWEANHMLLCDNTVDFSHVAYLHETTLGASGGQEEWANKLSKLSDLERGVRIERWFTDQKIPTPDGELVDCDLWFTYDFLLPGVLVMDTQFLPLGTGEKVSYKKPEGFTAITRTRSYQCVTPIDENNLRFFFSIQVPSHEPNSVLDRNWEVTKTAFAEDKLMIESQQKLMKKNPDARLRSTVHDHHTNYFRGLVKKAATLEVD